MMHPQTFIGLNKYGISEFLGIPIVGAKYGLDQLAEYVSANYSHVQTRGRTTEKVVVRHSIISVICHNKEYFEDLGLKKIGKMFNIDHATVINSRKKVDYWLDYPHANVDRLEIYDEIEYKFIKYFVRTAKNVRQII